MLDRRTFLSAAAAAVLPHTKVPAHSTDCHIHIYDSRYPADPKATLHPPDASVADYLQVQKQLGLARVVVVQPSTYGVDNRCMLEAVRQLGREVARGVAVVNTDVEAATLKEMDGAGVRGIRFNIVQAGATTLDMVEPLAKRIADLGWHIQVNATPEQIAAAAEIWKGLPVPVVFDHLAHIAAPVESDAAYRVVLDLLEKGKAWMKLSGADSDSKIGPPTYADRAPITKAYVKEAPERMVWGTNWPHPGNAPKPDNAAMLDLLAAWAPDRKTLARILVENPAALYRF